MKLKFCTTVLVLWAAAWTVHAQPGGELRFAGILNDNMVLQQKQDTRIWGWAPPGAELTVTITEDEAAAKPYRGAEPEEAEDGYTVSVQYVEENAPVFKPQTRKTVADDKGVWQVVFDPMPASFTPKAIVATSGDEGTAIDNVLIGEVWVCSGQSNMEWPNADNKDLWSKHIPLNGIRYTKYDHAWYRPLDDLPERAVWTVTSVESRKHFSAVAYLFARELHMNLHVPVGIINNARGGTTGSAWTSRDALLAIKAPEVVELMETYDGAAKEWATEAYAQKIADAREQIARVWRPKAKQAIAAHWRQHDTFMKSNLDAARYAEWKRIADGWHQACDDLHNGGPDALPPWKVWGLERKATEFLKGTGVGPPTMNYEKTLWKERPNDTDLRSGWSDPAGLFNASVRPLSNLAVAGILYYQGENNTFKDRWLPYRYIFPTVITAHRKVFGNEKLPFGIIGMAGCGSLNEDLEKSSVSSWARVREIHSQTHYQTPNTGLIVTYDCGQDYIHPGNKQPVAERAARWALGAVYGKEVAYGHCRYHAMEVKGDRIRLHFVDTVTGEVIVPGTFAESRKPRYKGFVIAGKDRQWHHADARQNPSAKALEVWSDQESEPVAVRYAWANFPDANLGRRHAPIPAFRTDNWPYPQELKTAGQ